MNVDRHEVIRFVALAARELADGEVCFVGIGVPSLAAMAAKRHHAPNAVLIYESGAVVRLFAGYRTSHVEFDNGVYAIFQHAKQTPTKIRVFVDYIADYFKTHNVDGPPVLAG